ncbi:hypothetical protein ACFX11_036310 [Malus domestica]
MFYLYNKPLNIVDGNRQYLFDENERRYLDGVGGIATVSCRHCHPDVVETIVNQTKRIQHSTMGMDMSMGSPLYRASTTVKFTRTLTNMGTPGTYKVTITSQAPLVKISVEPQSPTFSQAYKKKTYTVTFVAGSSPSGTSSFAVDRMIELPLR